MATILVNNLKSTKITVSAADGDTLDIPGAARYLRIDEKFNWNLPAQVVIVDDPGAASTPIDQELVLTPATGIIGGFRPPSNQDGMDRQLFFDMQNLTIYGPKFNNTWPAGIPLKGGKGDKGDQGIQGIQGPQGITGNTGPQGVTAQVSATRYADTTAGIAGTTNGQYFIVPSASPFFAGDLYQNVSSIATFVTSFIGSGRGQTFDLTWTKNSKVFWGVLDSNRRIAIGVKYDGRLIGKGITPGAGLTESYDRLGAQTIYNPRINANYYTQSGFIYAIKTPANRLLFGALSDGKMSGDFFEIGIANGLALSRRFNGRQILSLGTTEGKMPLANGGYIDTSTGYDFSGYYFGIVDSLRRMAIGIKPDGTVVIPKLSTSLVAPVTNKNVLALGDSLTNAYASYLSSYLAGINSSRTVYNAGIGGQVSTQIAMRGGGRKPRITLSGDVINSGANTITAINGQPIKGFDGLGGNVGADLHYMFLSSPATNATTTIKGSLCGIVGIITRTATGGPPSSSETYTFTPDSATGLPVNCSPGSNFIVDKDIYNYSTVVALIGSNNVQEPDIVMNDAIYLADYFKALGKNYLFISPFCLATFVKGSTYYNYTIDLAMRLQEKFPFNFFNLRRRIIELRDTNTPQDVIDYGNDVVGSTFRQDGIHFNNTKGNPTVAQLLGDELISRGW